MSKEPKRSFGDLLEEFLPSGREVSSDVVCTGEVRAVRKDFILVDVGLKSDGVISSSEFTPEEIAKIKVGDLSYTLLTQNQC